MTLYELKLKIGLDRFNKECMEAKEKAKFTGGPDLNSFYNSNIPHELSDYVWDSSIKISEKLKIAFELYEDLPCYAVLMYINLNFNEFSLNEKSMLWNKLRTYLMSEDEIHAKPIEYTIWCDYFEDDNKVEEAWDNILREPVNDTLIKRTLECSGPVPFKLKEELYFNLISDKKWHYYIYKSLLTSAFDYFGNIEKDKARCIIKNLNISKEIENFDRLKEFLDA